MENFNETRINQIPALQALMRLGYTYISPSDTSNQKILLEDILNRQLHRLNVISYRKKEYPISEENVCQAIDKLKILFESGLYNANEQIYELITQPLPYTQAVEGKIRNFGLIYIDWKNWENNVYHCTSQSHFKQKKEDIHLYINGIPLAILPCKTPQKNARGEIFLQERKYLSDLSSYVRLLFTAKSKSDLVVNGIAKVLSSLNESFYKIDEFDQTLEVCEENCKYIADIIEDHIKKD